MRTFSDTETKNKAAVIAAIEAAQRGAYPPPPYLAAMLKVQGVIVTRELVARYYKAAGIGWDETVGLWIKKGLK